MKRLFRSNIFVLLVALGLVLSGCSVFNSGKKVPPIEEPEPEYDELGLPMTGRQLWLRADEGVETEEGRVMKWIDQSGNENHAEAQDPDRAPSLIEDENGYKAVYFGTEEFLVVPHDDNLNAGRAFTVVYALKSDEKGGNRVMQKKSNASGTQEDAWHVARARGLNIAGKGAGSAVLDGTEFMIVSNVFNVAADKLEIYRDGEIAETVTGISPQIPNEDDLFIGLRDRADSLEWDGQMYELFIFNRALTDEERVALETYLMSKYAVEL